MKIKRLLFLSALALLIFALGIAFVKLADQDALLILHFDSYRGIDFFGTTADVFGIILLGIGMTLLNYTLARGVFRRDKVLGQIIAGASAFFALLICIAVFVIVGTN